MVEKLDSFVVRVVCGCGHEDFYPVHLIGEGCLACGDKLINDEVIKVIGDQMSRTGADPAKVWN